MTTVFQITLQEIGHNSGDVVREHVSLAYEGGALLDAVEQLRTRFPDAAEAALWRLAAARLKREAGLG